MNEWTVVSVIVVIVGLFLTVGKPIINLNSNIVLLNSNVAQNSKELKEQRAELKEQKKDAVKSHEELWDKNAEQDEQLRDHETRISILEKTS